MSEYEVSEMSGAIERLTLKAANEYLSLLGYPLELIKSLRNVSNSAYQDLLISIKGEYPELTQELLELFTNIEWLDNVAIDEEQDEPEIKYTEAELLKVINDSIMQAEKLQEEIAIKKVLAFSNTKVVPELRLNASDRPEYIQELINQNRLYPDGKRVMKSLEDVLDYLTTVLDPIPAKFIQETFFKTDGQSYTLKSIKGELSKFNSRKCTEKGSKTARQEK